MKWTSFDKNCDQRDVCRRATGPRLHLLLLLFGTFGNLNAEESGTYLLRAKKIYPVASAPIENGSVLVRDGLIMDVGTDIKAPEDARVLSIDGVLVPGFVDCGSTIGIHGRAAEEFFEMTPEMRVVDAIDLDHTDFRDALLSGVTTVAAGPGVRNVIGGLGVVLSTMPGSLESAVLREDAFLSVCLTRAATSGNRTLRWQRPNTIFHRQPTTRMGTIFLARRAFFEALELSGLGDDVSRPLKGAGESSLAQFLTTRGKSSLRESIQTRTIRIRADDKQEIVAALRVADEFKLSVVLEGCLEVADLIPELVRRRVDVLIMPGAHVSFPGDSDPDQVHDLARRLEAAGVRFGFISTQGSWVPYLAELVAIDIRFGLSEERALKALTLDAAAILGIDDRVGSIEVGKDADLVAFGTDPFSNTSSVLWTMSSGKIWKDETALSAQNIQPTGKTVK